MEENTNQLPPAPNTTPNQTVSQENPTSGSPKKNRMYPELIIPTNAHPNKLYAFPIIGFLIKTIMLIPVFIVGGLIGLVAGVLWLITPFTILFTGKYWDAGYTWAINNIIYTTKMYLFLGGITDKYPGFNVSSNGIFEMHLPKPEAPNRFLGFPIIGFFIRIILMIPYLIYLSILQYGMYFAVIGSWFGVLIKGTYPESFYEFIKDQLRVSIAYDAYIYYLSDTYPSFKISMNHKKTKIILLILGILFAIISNISSSMNNSSDSYRQAHTYNSSATNSKQPGSNQ